MYADALRRHDDRGAPGSFVRSGNGLDHHNSGVDESAARLLPGVVLQNHQVLSLRIE